MLYLLLFKFAILGFLIFWLIRRNNMAVKMWTDEQLIKSLPYYLKIKRLKVKSHQMKKFDRNYPLLYLLLLTNPISIHSI